MTSDPNSAKVHEITTTANLTGDQIAIRYVDINKAAFWDRNPKLHDIGGIVRSLELHGFRDAPIYDQNLNDGSGGIVAGNGRTAALVFMKSQGITLPRGVAVDKDGNWYMPVQFGIDADSLASAEAFGVDHNNLTLTGGDLTLFDIEKIWDQEALHAMLENIASEDHSPLASLDRDDIDMLLNGISLDWNSPLEEADADGELPKESTPITVRVGNRTMVEDVIRALNQLVRDNPDWEATLR